MMQLSLIYFKKVTPQLSGVFLKLCHKNEYVKNY
ncbi:MAG: hypothetical protein JWQ09_313 [Segetibacter sp.]|nr:hypothetical protein [Segetibacter sp.]